MGIMRTLTINGVTYDVVPVVPATTVTLLASAWEENGDVYSQVVEVPGATAYTKVDLQPTADQLAEFHYKVLAFVAENNNGIVTVYAIGDKPEDDHTIQITKTEVEATGKIRGNTVGTTMPRANLGQTDPRKADYVLGKETFLQSAVNDALAKAKESGDFSGENGSSIYYSTDNRSDRTISSNYAIGADTIINDGTMVEKGDTIITAGGYLFIVESITYDTESCTPRYYSCTCLVKVKGENGAPGTSVFYSDTKQEFIQYAYVYMAMNSLTLNGKTPAVGDLVINAKGTLSYITDVLSDTVRAYMLASLHGASGAPGVGIASITIEEVVMISFTIDGTPYKAELGMTWEQWLKSKYDTGGYELDVSQGMITDGSNWVTSEDGLDFIRAEDDLIDGYDYGLSP